MVLGFPGRVCRCQFSKPRQFIDEAFLFSRTMLKKVCLLFLLTASFVQGQNIDTNKVGFVTSNNSIVRSLDTSLSIQNYLAFNDYFQDDFGIIMMGNQGDVRRRLSFSPIISLHPNLGVDGYFKNYKRSSDVPFYNVKVPTGAFQFLQGYQQGQMFDGYFTVNPISRLNVFIDYSRLNSRGKYFNQENTADHLNISTRYATKNDVYRISGALSWNNFKNIEYGGVANVNDFETNKYNNRELIAVNLLNSGTKLQAVDSRLDQSLRLVKFDSLSELRAVYSFTTENQYMVFRSTDSVFTKNALFQGGEIRDSIRMQRISNLGGISLTLGDNEFGAGLVHTYYKYGNQYSLQSENLLGLKLLAKGGISRFRYELGFQNYFNGAYQGSYDFNGLLNYQPKRMQDFMVTVRARHGLYNVGLFNQQFISNNFVWLNSFKQIMQNEISGAIYYKNYGVDVEIKQLNNYVYFNKSALPAQLNGGLFSYKVDLKARIKFAKGLYLDNIIRYQRTDNEELVRIPDWVLRNILFYELSAFKNALNMHFGVEFQYFSSFASEAYMPATTIMYLQDETRIGDFPYFNFFANFKIKDFILFVRLENITQGIFDYNYYAAPSYPLPDFTFRFGASWRFFN